MSKQMLQGIVGLLTFGVYGGKFILALFAYSGGDYQRAALILLVGIVLEFHGFLFATSK